MSNARKQIMRPLSMLLAFAIILSMFVMLDPITAYALTGENLEHKDVDAIAYAIVGANGVATPVPYDGNYPIKEGANQVTLRGRYTGSGNQLAPVSPAFLTTVGLTGTHTTGNLGDSSDGISNIRIENSNPGTIFSQSNRWVRWPGVDLKGGIASIRMFMAANGDTRTITIRVAEPGAGFNASQVVASIVLSQARPAGDWQQRWIRWPSPPAKVCDYALPFISTSNSSNVPAGTSNQENPSWDIIEDSKLMGVCDVYVHLNADTQFSRVVLELKPEPIPQLYPPDDSHNVDVYAIPGDTDRASRSTVLSNDDAWVKWENYDIQGGISGFELLYEAEKFGAGRSMQVLVAEPGTPEAPSKIEDAVLVGWVSANAAGNEIIALNDFIRYHTGGPKDVYIRFINAKDMVLTATKPEFYANPMPAPGSSVEMSVPDATGADWIRYNDVDLKAGLKSFDIEYTGSGDHARNFDVLIAKADQRDAIGSGSILANGRTIIMGGTASSALDPSRFGPGIAICDPANTLFDGTMFGGVRDVYVRTRGATTNLQKMVVYMEDGSEPHESVPPEDYVETLETRPSKADVTPYLRTRQDAHATLPSGTDGYGTSGETPMGNGYMGATIYGGVVQDYIVMNEKTLWSGGPGASESYNGSHGRGSVTSEASKNALASIRQDLDNRVNFWANQTTGGPGPTGTYPANMIPTSSTPSSRTVAYGIEQNLMGPKTNFGSYQEIGKIVLRDPVASLGTVPGETSVYDPDTYRRYLNLETGIATTNYSRVYQTDNTLFKKEYFMNYDSNVFAIKMSTPSGKPFSQTVSFETLQSRGKIAVDGENHIIQMTGQPAGHGENGLYFISQMKVVAKDAAGNDISDAAITAVSNGLKVENASEIIVLYVSGTNYKNILDTGFMYEEPYVSMSVAEKNRYINSLYLEDKDIALDRVKTRLNAAVQKGYNALLAEHLDDYQELFGRVEFQLTDELGKPIPVPSRPTGDLVSYSSQNKFNNASANEKRYMEMLYFQFGRYLMLASSREGSLPANLQGVWAWGLSPPWDADYHTNINVQMNYWPVETTNLSESHIPMLQYAKAQVPRGNITANWYHSPMDGENNRLDVDAGGNSTGRTMRGWTSYHENNIWGNTGPANYWQGAYAPAGGTWMSQDFWEYYQFTQDKDMLKEYYDALVGAALFWVDNLYEDMGTRDGYVPPATAGADPVNAGIPGTGKLVAAPSYSPEHGPYDLGTTFEQGVIWEVFDMAQKAYAALQDDDAFLSTRDALVADRDGAGKSAATEIAEIAAAKDRLYLPDYIPDESDDPDNGTYNGEYVGIGSWANGGDVGKGNGQFMEWRYETQQDARGTEDSGSSLHRHANHLFMLHPGTRIVPGRSDQEDKFTEAMKVTLNTRGDGGTGWSRAWKINFWARLRDGERARTLYGELLNGSTLPNLWDTHTPYQIDGNFGGTAGVAEMLMQSHGGYIELLAALPRTTWANGSVKGLKARGNVEVDQYWINGVLTRAVLRPGTTGEISVKYPGPLKETIDDVNVYYPGLDKYMVFDKNGNELPASLFTLSDGIVTFDAIEGETYTFAVTRDAYTAQRAGTADELIKAPDAQGTGISYSNGDLINVERGDTAVFKYMNFGAATTLPVAVVLELAMPADRATGTIDVYAEAPGDPSTRKHIATVTEQNTANINTFRQVYANLLPGVADELDGVFDVYVVWSGNGGPASDLRSIRFLKTDVDVGEHEVKFEITLDGTPTPTPEVIVRDDLGRVVPPTETPLVYKLIANSYTYTVTADGYRTRSGAFTVAKSDEPIVIKVTLPDENAPGELMFNVTPSAAAAGQSFIVTNTETGAEYTIPNSGSGIDPTRTAGFLLPPGLYAYEVRSNGYNTVFDYAEVGEAALVVNVPMTATGTASTTEDWRFPNSSDSWTDRGATGKMDNETGGYAGQIGANTWIKWASKDLKGGIESLEFVVGARGTTATNATVSFYAVPAGTDVPAAALDLTGGSYPINRIAYANHPALATGSAWNQSDWLNTASPHENARFTTLTVDTPNGAGLYSGVADVYAVFAGEWNFGGARFVLKPAPVGTRYYDITFTATPASARNVAIAVTKLDNTPCTPKSGSDNVFNLAEGFYKYTISADGYAAQSGLLKVAGAPAAITAALMPVGGEYRRYEAEDIDPAGRPYELFAPIIDASEYSGGKAVSFGHSIATNRWANFSVISDETGIAVVKLKYSGVYSGNITIKANDDATKTVALNSTGESVVNVDVMSLYDVDGNALPNVLYLTNLPRNLVLDYIEVFDKTLPGSVEANELAEPYVPNVNPIIKTIFTADPEAKVWPNEPHKLYIYPSHDTHPQAGCDRMDQYHVYSTTNLIDWVDEGEILRYQDIVDSKNDPDTNYWPAFVPTAVGVDSTRSTFMWAPDAAYRDGWYYYYWPVPRDIATNWGATWETGVRRSRFPTKNFEEIPEEEAYPGFQGFIKELSNGQIDIAVRVFKDPERLIDPNGDPNDENNWAEQGYFWFGGGQHLWQGKLKDNMCEVDGPVTLISCSNGASCNTYSSSNDPNRKYVNWCQEVKNVAPNFHEGPSMFRKKADSTVDPKYVGKDGYTYYLIYPASGLGSMNGLSGDAFAYHMASTPMGPWGSNETTHGVNTNKGIFYRPHGNTTSHGSVVEFMGEWLWISHTGDLPGGTDQIRSVTMEKLTFKPDGTFQGDGVVAAHPDSIGKTTNAAGVTRPPANTPNFNKYYEDGVEVHTGNVPGIEAGTPGKLLSSARYSVNPASPEYKPGGANYGASVTHIKDENGAGGILYWDAKAGGDGFVASSMTATGRGLRFEGVDGGAPAYNGKGNRGRIYISYSTTVVSPIAKMRLSVNGVNHSNVNFTRTGGKSFYAEINFTPRALNPGKDNVIELYYGQGATGKVNINYVEVILFDDSEAPNEIEVVRKGSDDAINQGGTATFTVGTNGVVNENNEPLDGSLPVTLQVYNPQLAGKLSVPGTIGIEDGIGTLTVTADSSIPIGLYQTALTVTIGGIRSKAFDLVVEVKPKSPRELLFDLITEASELVESDYTESSWSVLSSALDFAETIYEDAAATDGRINAAISILQNAIDALEREAGTTVNKDVLNALIESMSAFDPELYTPETWTGVETALEAAVEVAANDDATQADVNDAVKTLLDKIAALKLIGTEADKSALQALVDVAKGLDPELYDAETWGALQEALATAEDVLADEDATQDEVDEAADALKEAIEELTELIPVTSIKINSAATTTVRKNKTLQLGVILTPSNANFGTEIKWASSNEASVKVDAETGLLTGIKAGGSARVTATSSNGKTYTITVTVDS